MSTGRPPHEPTPALRRLVEHHAATGTLHRQIAKLLGLSLNTLKKHYREELDLGSPVPMPWSAARIQRG